MYANIFPLACYQERYEQMRGTKFLYGTHYSAPGYVLYYLVRAGNSLHVYVVRGSIRFWGGLGWMLHLSVRKTGILGTTLWDNKVFNRM